MDRLPPLDDTLTEVLLRTDGGIFWLHISEDDEITVVPTYKEATAFAWESPWRDSDGEPVYGVIDENGEEIGLARATWL